MRAQHQPTTSDSSRPEIEPWHEATVNQSKQNNKSRSPGAEFQKESNFKKRINLNLHLHLNLNLNLNLDCKCKCKL